MWSILEWIFGCIFGSVFGVHFCPFFGQFSIADLLVLRDFLAHEGGFWPFFRRVFDRTFDRTFAHFATLLFVRWLTGHCCALVAYQVVAALASGPFVDQYRGRELLLAAYFAGFRPILWGISSDPGHIKS